MDLAGKYWFCKQLSTLQKPINFSGKYNLTGKYRFCRNMNFFQQNVDLAGKCRFTTKKLILPETVAFVETYFYIYIFILKYLLSNQEKLCLLCFLYFFCVVNTFYILVTITISRAMNFIHILKNIQTISVVFIHFFLPLALYICNILRYFIILQ